MGVGNTLRHDDGIGPAIIRYLRDCDIANKICFLDGGTDSMALIDYIKEYKNVIIVDAVNMGLVPGEIRVFSPDEALVNANSDSLSTHGFGLAEVLGLIKRLELRNNLKIVGIQPKEVSIGDGLSKEVTEKMEEIILTIRNIIDEKDILLGF